MGLRFLFARRYYVWCALVVLAFVPQLSHAVTYVTPDTSGYYKALDGQWYRRDGTGPQYTINTGKIHSTSKVNTGVKVLSLPSTMTVAATAGRGVLTLARLSGPALMTTALLEYLIDHTDGDLYVDDDEIFLTDENELQQRYWRVVAAGKTAYGESCASACSNHAALVGGYYADANINRCANQANSTSPGTCANAAGWHNGYVSGPLMCPSGQTYRYGVGCGTHAPLEEPPTETDWDEWFSRPFDPLTDQQADDLAQTPAGVEIEGPVTLNDLPDVFPLSEPYQTPTGGWEQPVASVTPGPNGTVGVETYVQPTTGPEGIPDPASTPRPITNTPTSGSGETTPAEIEVNLCEDGDTNLACVELGTPDETELEKDEFELDFDHAPVAFTSGSCPQGPSFSTPWGSQEFDMYWPCEFASAIKPIILALGAFAAMGIFVGGLRTG